MTYTVSEQPDRSVFDAIFAALDGASRDVIGPARGRLLVVPLRDDANSVIGGLWGVTLFRWLAIEMLFVPATLRGQGIGAALLAAAEVEARERGCLGIQVDAFAFQAVGFYQRFGFAIFGVLDDCPPGHRRLFLQKRLM